VPTSPHRVAVAGCAVLAASLLTSGAASAATSHAPSSRHTAHTAPSSHRPADHLAGARKGAAHALNADIARLRRITAAAAASTVLDPSDKASLAVAEASDLDALTTDRQTIAAATSIRTMRAAVLAGTRTVLGAQLQLRLVTAAGRSGTTAQTLTASAATTQHSGQHVVGRRHRRQHSDRSARRPCPPGRRRTGRSGQCHHCGTRYPACPHRRPTPRRQHRRTHGFGRSVGSAGHRRAGPDHSDRRTDFAAGTDNHRLTEFAGPATRISWPVWRLG
jgi:hypothetical protein